MSKFDFRAWHIAQIPLNTTQYHCLFSLFHAPPRPATPTKSTPGTPTFFLYRNAGGTCWCILLRPMSFPPTPEIERPPPPEIFSSRPFPHAGPLQPHK
jgi:hypothetical protein